MWWALDLSVTDNFDTACTFRAKFDFVVADNDGKGKAGGEAKGVEGNGEEEYTTYIYPDVVTPQTLLFLCKQGNGISQITVRSTDRGVPLCRQVLRSGSTATDHRFELKLLVLESQGQGTGQGTREGDDEDEAWKHGWKQANMSSQAQGQRQSVDAKPPSVPPPAPPSDAPGAPPAAGVMANRKRCVKFQQTSSPHCPVQHVRDASHL